MAKNTQQIDIALLTEIAARHLDIETLEERKVDDLDFHQVAVWTLRAALEAAFAAGRASAELDQIDRA